jgi:hypothetical protein
MSSGAIRVRRLAGFFIVAAFATSRGPSADEAKAITALGEHDRQEPSSSGIAEEHRAGLSLGVSRIVDDEAEWVTEGGNGLVEGDPMLAGVRLGLVRVPFEGERHGE